MGNLSTGYPIDSDGKILFDTDPSSTAVGFASDGASISANGVRAILVGSGGANAFFNVLDYGANGNGVADNSAAFTAAFAAVPAGGTLLIPQAEVAYLFNSGLTLSKPVFLFGFGAKSILRTSSAGFHLFTLEADDVTMCGLRLEGAAISATPTAPLAIGSFAIYSVGATHAPQRFTMTCCQISGPDVDTGFNNGVKLESEYNALSTAIISYSEGHQFAHNLFERQIGDNGVTGAGYGILNAGTKNLVAHDNVFKGRQSGVVQGRHAIYSTVGVIQAKIYANNVSGYNEDSFPVFSHGNQPACQYNQFWGNTISGEALGGTNSAPISFAGNCQFNKAFGNLIFDSAGPGLCMNDGGSGGLCSENEFFDNKILRPGQEGVRMLGTQNCRSVDNRVIDASYLAHGTYPAYQILSYNADVPCRGTTLQVEANTDRDFFPGAMTGNAVNPITITTYGVFAVLDASNTTPVILTLASPSQCQVGDKVFTDGILGNAGANGTSLVGVVGVDGNGNQTLELTELIGTGAYTGQGVARARTLHGAGAGDTLKVADVLGNTAANGEYQLSAVTTTTISFIAAGNGTWTQNSGRLLLPTHRNGMVINNTAPLPTETTVLPSSILPIFGLTVEVGAGITLIDSFSPSGSASTLADPNTLALRDNLGSSGFVEIGLGTAPLATTANDGINSSASAAWYAKSGLGAGDITIVSIDGADDVNIGDATKVQTLLIRSANLLRLGAPNIGLQLTAGLTSSFNPIQMNDGTITIANDQTPLWRLATQGSDIGTNNWTFRSQGAFAGATGANRAPGQINFDISAPTNGGTDYGPGFWISLGTSQYFSVGSHGGSVGTVELQDATPPTTATAGRERIYGEGGQLRSQAGITSAGTGVTKTLCPTLTNGAIGTHVLDLAQYTGIVQTVDATPTKLITVPIPANSTACGHVIVEGKTNGGTDRGCFLDAVALARDGGNAYVVGAPVDLPFQSGALVATALTYVVNGGNIDITVTGVAATTIDWAGSFEPMKYTP